MTKLIKISDLTQEPKKLKPVEFIHCYFDNRDWTPAIRSKPNDFAKVIHIGSDNVYDYFIAFNRPDYIYRYRGHLNDGVIE